MYKNKNYFKKNNKKMKNKLFLLVTIFALTFFCSGALAETSPLTNVGGPDYNPSNLSSLGGSSSNASSGWNIDSLSSFGLPEASIYQIVVNLLNWILAILGIAGVIGFAISGLMYLFAAGNEDMVGKAKKAMTASILGVIVGLSGLVVINAIDAALNAFSF